MVCRVHAPLPKKPTSAFVNASKNPVGLVGGGSALWFATDIDYVGNSTQLFTSNGGIYAFTGGIGATMPAVLAGHGFAKYRFRGRNLSFAILLGAVMVLLTALVIPTFAARIDGAGELRTFVQVALPLMRPAIVTVLLLSVVATWNNCFLPLAMLPDSELYR